MNKKLKRYLNTLFGEIWVLFAVVGLFLAMVLPYVFGCMVADYLAF